MYIVIHCHFYPEPLVFIPLALLSVLLKTLYDKYAFTIAIHETATLF